MADSSHFTTTNTDGSQVHLLNPDASGSTHNSPAQPLPGSRGTSREPSQTPSSTSPSTAGEGSLSPTTSMRPNSHARARADATIKKKYVCDICDKAFSTSGHLTRHSKVHTGDKPFICPYPRCEKKCSRDDNLVQHFQVHLPKEDRKRGIVYIRDAIAEMRNTTDVSRAVLLLAGLPSPVPPVQGEEVDEDDEAEDEEHGSTRQQTPLSEERSVAPASPVRVHKRERSEQSERRSSSHKRRRSEAESSTSAPRTVHTARTPVSGTSLDNLAKVAAELADSSVAPN
ncbi:hypothetical protein CALCODRAFT_446734 [Calocera cornea HHB12733]|uniref:C2H2-type domain-containing protein n=1 Tax=Calocera cornea HHB12733 TaxID=1353952 RepID=A0A165JNI9_9BASI|nr:hypothetical protein CALCODRAFT_446734 [Calocera cornea HHB12733]